MKGKLFEKFQTQDARRTALVVIGLFLLCGAVVIGLGYVVPTFQQPAPTDNASSGNNTASASKFPSKANGNPSAKDDSETKNKVKKTLNIAHTLANMSDEKSQKFIEKHPKKKKIMIEALMSENITQAAEMFIGNPNGMAKYLLHKTNYGGDHPEWDGGLSYLPDD